MAIVVGTNAGFVIVAPTADPAGSLALNDGNFFTSKYTSPATAQKIYEIGWWCDSASEESNFEVGLYAADGAAGHGEAGTLLQVSRTNAKGTGAGWKVVTVDWAISANTVYWIAVQVDNTLTDTYTNCRTTGVTGGGFDTFTTKTTLPDPAGGGTISDPNGTMAYYAVWVVPLTITTQATSSVAATTATGNGNITNIGGENNDQRGIVYSTTTHGDPGNVAPGSSSYSGLVNETGGSFGTGAFTEALTGLTSRTTYYARAYAHNSAGYSYGSEVSFTTIGFTNPGNIYATDDAYATLAATSGILSVEVSKDAGANWSAPLTVTFTGADSLQTVGAGATELFVMSFTRADMVNANFRIRLSQGNISQVYKTFGFATGSELLTGIEIAIEGKYASSTLSLDLLEVKIHYGTSVLPVQAGSQVYASNGRKAGEGVGAGTGVLVYYDSASKWIASDTGAEVAA